MSNREYIGKILTEVFHFLRDHGEPTVEEVREFCEVINAILREVCGDSYPQLPLKSGAGKFYKKGDK